MNFHHIIQIIRAAANNIGSRWVGPTYARVRAVPHSAKKPPGVEGPCDANTTGTLIRGLAYITPWRIVARRTFVSERGFFDTAATYHPFSFDDCFAPPLFRGTRWQHSE